MAPTSPPPVNRSGGFVHTAGFSAQHFLLFVIVERAASAVHAPGWARVAVALGSAVGHWYLHRHRGPHRSDGSGGR